MKDKIYKSKFGWGVFLFLSCLFMFTSWMSYQPERGILESFAMLLVPIVVLGSFTAISLATKYTLSATELHIKCLPFYNKKIAIDSINKVTVSRNLISSPAPSLDRIEVYFNKYESLVISPKNKFQFMDDLKKINPSIIIVKQQ